MLRRYEGWSTSCAAWCTHWRGRSRNRPWEYCWYARQESRLPGRSYSAWLRWACTTSTSEAGLIRLICNLAQLYVVAIIARAVLSWIEVPGDHPVGRAVALLSRIVDPPLRPLRRSLPAIPVGGVRLDLSPIILILAIMIVTRIICR
ncbi:MAG: YggT family protein [Acidimicrobiia bacterium]|nr:YggT family protein [Acidimicrobiia bacterium]MYB44403.1 YggT family protein [Acidimicrobiia bacterium]MYC84955.1 YggT family protein [Acidimicrobiia bacterium]